MSTGAWVAVAIAATAPTCWLVGFCTARELYLTGWTRRDDIAVTEHLLEHDTKSRKDTP